MQSKSDRTWLKLGLESAGEEALLDKMATDHPGSTPTFFISYSWDTEEHKAWVREFAARLRADGIDVTLDQWHRVILDGTTIKEVQDVHRETLLVVVDRVEELIAEYKAKKQRRAEAEAAKVASHKEEVLDITSKISFD
jgi:hypothetical protein